MNMSKKSKNSYVVKVTYPTLPAFYVVGDQTGDSRESYYKSHKTSLRDSVSTLETFDLPEGWRDYNIHEELKKLSSWVEWDGEADEGYLKTRECFYIKKDSGKTEEDLLDEIRRICTGTTRKYEYVLRPYQNNTIRELISKFITNNSVLLYSLPRTGKSLMSIALALHLGYDTIVVTTPFAKAEESFRAPVVNGKTIEVDGYVYELEGWRFYDKDNLNEWDGNPHKCVFFLSFALERQKDDSSKFNTLLKGLKTSKASIFSVVDEIHNTSDTSLSEGLLNSLNADKTLHMSGTPYNDLLQGRFNEKNTVKFDLFDAIAAMSDPRNNLDFPKMGVYQPYNIDTLLTDYMNRFPQAKNFECNNYAITMSSKAAAEYFLGKMFSKVNDRGMFSIEKKETVSDRLGNHVFLYIEDNFKTKVNGKATIVDTMSNCLSALRELVKDTNSYLHGYEVKSSDDFNDEESVNAFQKKNRKTIIVSKQKFTTGSTFDRLDTIILLRSISSTEMFTQIIYRVMTPFEGKGNVNILVLDAEMGLKLSAGMIESRRLTSPNDKADELFNKLKDFITFSLYDMDFNEISPMNLLKKVKGICSKDVFNVDYRGLGRITNLDSFYNRMTDREKESLLNSSISGTKVGGNISVKGKNKLPEIPSDPDAEGGTKGATPRSINNKKELEKIRTIVSSIPKNIFVADLKTYEEIMGYIPKSIESVKDIYIKFIKENEKTVRVWLGDMRMAMDDIDDEDSFFMENFC